ncbi:MAG TPA: Re/Si-specific NAD(P)(+) transhydrogenase subunit alpha [Polyangiaceae bacterium]|nr:Re/Si-specific NAD(P)(+) transhydrogenase subunit alpha [Polyangiaceae bacterium]
MPLTVLVARERVEGETRVSATPDTVKQMIKAGLAVTVEAGAGESAFFSDKAFTDAGATVVADPKAAWGAADVVLKVRAPEKHASLDEIEATKDGAVVIGFLAPYKNDEMIRRYAAKRVISLPMELVPRITRAQKMDALSSQANIAGYKAVLVAAVNLPKYFPLFMTAAGTVKPARVVIMGAGVAGLQAIATAKRLGAVVEASDVRPETKEQILSLGGKFIELPKTEETGSGQGGYAKEMSADFLKAQQEIVGRHVAQADVVVTTALVPGRPAPKLLPAWIVEKMKPGAVIVDLAVEQGGNCELSEKDKEVRKHGVLIIGPSNLPATMPGDASMLYARNVFALLQNVITKEGALNIDVTDEVTSGTLLTNDGKIVHGPTAQRLGG